MNYNALEGNIRQDGESQNWTEGLIIDHTCLNLSEIPENWIDKAQDEIKLHYAHTSHGGQLTTGLQRLQNINTNYSISRGSSTLPDVNNSLCIFDGQEGDTYISPNEYWDGETARNSTSDVLTNNPSIKYSMWSWCCQMDSYGETYVQNYLAALAILEAAHPGVTFIYMTGNAQAGGPYKLSSQTDGYRRYQNNELIRQYCRQNNKILFDFGNIDSWCNGTQNSYQYDNGTAIVTVPCEHQYYNASVPGQSGHTTYENCENKGRAVWWMLARLAGWEGMNGSTITTSQSTTTATATSSTSQSSTTITTTQTPSQSKTTTTTPNTSQSSESTTNAPTLIILLIGVIMTVIFRRRQR